MGTEGKSFYEFPEACSSEKFSGFKLPNVPFPWFQIKKLRQDIGQFHASRIRQESVSNASKLEK